MSMIQMQAAPQQATLSNARPAEVLLPAPPTDHALPNPTRRFAWKIKRTAEYVLAILALTALAMPMLAIAAAIRLESPGPALFRQPRYGKANQPFHVLKFRTMRADRCDLSGGMQTAHHDPRVTRFGMFLRKSSLDELPQLLNILFGQMALIGPRAHPCGMRVDGVLCEDLNPDYMLRHVVPPGITGWAQVNGSRGPVDTPGQLVDRVALDLDYIRHWSLCRDVVILFSTVGVCIRAQGAR